MNARENAIRNWEKRVEKMEEEKERSSQRNSNILPPQRRMSPMNKGFIRPISA